MKHGAASAVGQGPLEQLARVQAQLEALQGELDQANKLAILGTLTAGIAHEINNILTPVLAYAQLARANPDDAALSHKALDQAIAGVESASRITEAVLGFTRTGEQPARAHVAEVVSASLATIGRDPARDGIEVSVRVPSSLEVAIKPLSLQQVVMNLLINAMNAMPRRGGRISVEAREQADGHAAIVVSDTGPGIPEPLLPDLFSPFVSGSPGHKSPNGWGGSGLGLAVCRRLIENAGGTINVESAKDEGASFTIILRSIT